MPEIVKVGIRESLPYVSDDTVSALRAMMKLYCSYVVKCGMPFIAAECSPALLCHRCAMLGLQAAGVRHYLRTSISHHGADELSTRRSCADELL